MTVLRLSTIGLVALCIAPTAHTYEFRSTYSETRSCPVTEESDDAFIRECPGPGGVRAVLQYVEGLFGVFYLPMGGKTPLELEDMLEVSPTARYPYGAKLEWRQRVGEPAPCVAIIRAYTSRGEVLVLNELATGDRIGMVSTNQQAHSIADRVCSSLETQSESAEAKGVSSPASTAMVSDTTSVASAARDGQERFMKVYLETGISGAITEIEECYSDFDRQPSLAKLANCGAIDLTGADADRSVMAGLPNLQQTYFAQDGSKRRITARMDRLGLADDARTAFFSELEVSTKDLPRARAFR